jgi:hypothetical protein
MCLPAVAAWFSWVANCLRAERRRFLKEGHHWIRAWGAVGASALQDAKVAAMAARACRVEKAFKQVAAQAPPHLL